MEFGEGVVGRVDAQHEADESVVGVVDGTMFGFGEACGFQEVFVDAGADGSVHGVTPWGEQCRVGWGNGDGVNAWGGLDGAAAFQDQVAPLIGERCEFAKGTGAGAGEDRAWWFWGGRRGVGRRCRRGRRRSICRRDACTIPRSRRGPLDKLRASLWRSRLDGTVPFKSLRDTVRLFTVARRHRPVFGGDQEDSGEDRDQVGKGVEWSVGFVVAQLVQGQVVAQD